MLQFLHAFERVLHPVCVSVRIAADSLFHIFAWQQFIFFITRFQLACEMYAHRAY